MSSSFRMLPINHLLTNHVYMNKEDLALNSLQGLIWHKNKSNHMDVPLLADQQELIYIGSVWTQDVVGKTC